MKSEEIINIIRKEISSYQDTNAPERMALARLITRFEKQDNDGGENAS